MEATLVQRRDVGGGLLLVEIDVPPEIAQSYQSPGQYIEVTFPEGSGYFVLASEAGAATFELLVRNAGEAAGALFSRPLPATLRISSALGAGFPMSRARGKPLVVAVVRSAMAAARPILGGRIRDGEASSTQVLVGLRRPDDLPLAYDVATWTRAGIGVALCLSAPGTGGLPHDLGIRCEEGYVQEVLARSYRAGRVAPGTLVFAAGPVGMFAEMIQSEAASTGALEVIANG